MLTLLVEPSFSYHESPIRRDLWRAGHAHAGILLMLSLLAYLYVDKARLSAGVKRFVCTAIPLSAIFIPAAFFLSVLPPDATEPNALIYLAYVGAISLVVGLIVLGIGLVRRTDRHSSSLKESDCEYKNSRRRQGYGDIDFIIMFFNIVYFKTN